MVIECLILFCVLFAGFRFPELFGKSLTQKDVKALRWLFVYHLFFAGVFCMYTLHDGSSDSISYWNKAKGLSYKEAIYYLFDTKGTAVMYSLNYFPSKVLDLSYFTGTMLYSLFGYMGLTFFYIVALKTIPYNIKVKSYYLFPTIFFLPNLHFWSGGIGKDTLLFFCIGLFVYSLLSLNKRLPLALLSLGLSYIIRPHITLFLLLSFSMGYLLTSKISLSRRIILSIMLIAGGLAILPKVMEYAKIEDTSVEGFNKFSNNKSVNLSQAHTGSSVDISSYPLPLKVFTFLYRPLFFDINGVPAVLASFENFLLLYLTFMVLKKRPFYTFKAAPLVIKGLVIFLLIGTLAFSTSLGNLGIMIRMRNMFLPALMIFIIWSYSLEMEDKIKKNIRLKALRNTKVNNALT